jgi:chromosomal replication initiation ATPase DnaA
MTSEPTTSTRCEFCDALFTPIRFDLPGPSGSLVEVKTTACPSCAKAKQAKTVVNLAPVPIGEISVKCMVCQWKFQTEAVRFPGDGKTLKDAISHATVCDLCAAKEQQAKPARENPTPEDRRRRLWVSMTGVRYADFRASELPETIQPHVEKVLGWTVQPKGIGLVGPSRAGKSPLLYALGASLFIAGHEVFPTTGIEFQRKYQRSFDKDETYAWADYLKACEESEVLLIDDADKLNLTPGVEAEYYGMLETRRNWQRPVLCTLNLTGSEFAALGRERSDRAAAIVERLRDLCEFIPVS